MSKYIVCTTETVGYGTKTNEKNNNLPVWELMVMKITENWLKIINISNNFQPKFPALYMEWQQLHLPAKLRKANNQINRNSCFCSGQKTCLYCAKVHSLVWFPSKRFVMKVKTIKNFQSLHNKALDSICVKSCVCVCVSFSLSFFYQFSGMIRILSLINLQLFPAVTKSARHKRQCGTKTVLFIPHLLTLGWLNFCRWSSLCW